MNKNDVSIATMTWARDKQERQLLGVSLSRLAELEIPVFVTDGGSGTEFINFLEQFSHFTIFQAQKPGVLSQIRQSIQAASESNPKFILYTEPDKAEFFESRLSRFISEAASDDNIGVVTASRTLESFATFPEFQQYTEAAINRCCAEVIGGEYDYSYGPFLFNPKLIPYLKQLEDAVAWGWRIYAFGVARRLNYKIDNWEEDLPCPASQKDCKAERIYRMKQLSQALEGLIRSTTLSL